MPAGSLDQMKPKQLMFSLLRHVWAQLPAQRDCLGVLGGTALVEDECPRLLINREPAGLNLGYRFHRKVCFDDRVARQIDCERGKPED